MFSKDNQVLNIDNAITPGHRTYVTQWLICTPIINNDTHIRGIDNFVAVEVNNRDD